MANGHCSLGRKWQSQDSNPVFLTQKPMFLFTVPVVSNWETYPEGIQRHIKGNVGAGALKGMVDFIFQKWLKQYFHPHPFLETCHTPIRRRSLCIFPLNLGGSLWTSQLIEWAEVMPRDFWGEVHLDPSLGILVFGTQPPCYEEVQTSWRGPHEEELCRGSQGRPRVWWFTMRSHRTQHMVVLATKVYYMSGYSAK